MVPDGRSVPGVVITFRGSAGGFERRPRSFGPSSGGLFLNNRSTQLGLLGFVISV
jgi:hypothetical protein